MVLSVACLIYTLIHSEFLHIKGLNPSWVKDAQVLG